MTFEIDGLDITPYIAFGGIKWQRSDVDATKTTRSLSGKLLRARVATKVRLDITCIPLVLKDASKVLTAIMPEWVQVKYTDPQLGCDVTRKMYSNNNPASFAIKKSNGDECWGGITFPLIEE